jgi:hypothetical protein
MVLNIVTKCSPSLVKELGEMLSIERRFIIWISGLTDSKLGKDLLRDS